MELKRSNWRHAWRAGLVLLAFCPMLPHPASAQGDIVVTTNHIIVTNIVLVTNYVSKPSAANSLDWTPATDEHDWVQLKSGEWLKGRIKAMQDRKLEFDSEELKMQSFDWKDVRRLRSPHSTDVLLEGRDTISGPIEVTPDEIKIGGEEARILPRRDVVSLTPGGKLERNYWTGKAAAGATFRSGNTEQAEYNAKAELQRRTPATRLALDYLGYFSKTEGVKTANSHRSSAFFDVWLSRRLFVRAPFVEYFQDPFQNIAHRATAGIGLGYDIIDRPGLEWNLTVGPAYQQTWFESVQPGEEEDSGAGSLVFTSRFDWEITPRIDLILFYKGLFTSREVGETTHHGESTLSLELTRRLDLDLSLYWDRTEFPKASADGSIPKQNDFRLVLSLGVDF